MGWWSVVFRALEGDFYPVLLSLFTEQSPLLVEFAGAGRICPWGPGEQVQVVEHRFVLSESGVAGPEQPGVWEPACLVPPCPCCAPSPGPPWTPGGLQLRVS